jgi:cytidine deaminase
MRDCLLPREVGQISGLPQISAAQVDQWQKAKGKTVDQIMLELLPLAQAFARAPISGFPVAAVVRATSGALYLGANLEIPGQPLYATVHAEQAAASIAYMHGESGIEALATTSAPCGYCRQFLEEMAPGGEIRVLLAGRRPVRLQWLLPAAFGPNDLGRKQGALPMSRVKIGLVAEESDPVMAAALSAACASYAPYTGAHSGVAVQLSDGSLYTGTYIENAAFNPILPPFQAALISVLSTGLDLEEITDVVLVEMDGAVVSQKSATEDALSTLRPTVRLRTALGRGMA